MGKIKKIIAEDYETAIDIVRKLLELNCYPTLGKKYFHKKEYYVIFY